MRSAQSLVLIVEDSPTLAEMYARHLAEEPVRVVRAETLRDARKLLSEEVPAAILLDLHLPDGNGIDFLTELRRDGHDSTVVVNTAHGSINTAVDAMRAGANDFLMKPFAKERLLTTLRNGLEKRQLEHLVRAVSPTLGTGQFEGFIGDDLSMQAVYRIVEQVGRTNATVFITGESGTGKEVCAEAIHRRSQRRDGPFVALNCGAIPKDLVESEIFGHLRGAFTGATADREGAASRAAGGTLFLDEICEMDLPLQTKLLRFVQTGFVQKVGSDKPVKVDVRLICATNRDPWSEVEAGRFREDLYYRLHVVPVELPPLRERGKDVLLIAQRFLEDFSLEDGRHFEGFTPEAERVLLNYDWPGNVRQLQNAVRQVTVLFDGDRVTPEMLPSPPRRAGAAPAMPQPHADDDAILPLAEVERRTIEHALAACDGNMTEAAQRLGISVKTIYRKRLEWSAT